jgi:hypothetical protein
MQEPPDGPAGVGLQQASLQVLKMGSFGRHDAGDMRRTP